MKYFILLWSSCTDVPISYLMLYSLCRLIPYIVSHSQKFFFDQVIYPNGVWRCSCSTLDYIIHLRLRAIEGRPCWIRLLQSDLPNIQGESIQDEPDDAESADDVGEEWRTAFQVLALGSLAWREKRCCISTPTRLKGFCRKESRLKCLAIPGDPWEAHTDRFPVGDEEDYERTNMTDFVLL